jgi:hypothetical protein
MRIDMVFRRRRILYFYVENSTGKERSQYMKRKAKKALTFLLVISLLTTCAFMGATPAQARHDICEIVGYSGYDDFGMAMADVIEGDTVRLLENVTYLNGVILSGINITFDLNGYTLNIINSAGIGLDVTNGSIGLAGAGPVNVTGTSYGVFAEHATVRVTTAQGTSAGGTGAAAVSGGAITVESNASGGEAGVYARDAGSTAEVYGTASGVGASGKGAWARDGGNITVYGADGILYGAYAEGSGSILTVTASATASGGSGVGAYAVNGGTVDVAENAQAPYYGACSSGANSHMTVRGNAIATGTNDIGAFAYDGGWLSVYGNAQGAFDGVLADGTGSYAEVGSATATAANGAGVEAVDGGTIHVSGNVASSGVGAGTIGAIASGGGSVVIDGAITSGATYIQVDGTVKDGSAGSRANPTTRAGYYTYSSGTSTVWVRATDTTLPTIIIVTPSGTTVPVGTTALTIKFSEPMNTASPGTVTINHGAVLSALGTWSADGKLLTYTLSGLTAGTAYSLAISGFRDAAGNAMAADSTHSFTTAAASGSSRIIVLTVGSTAASINGVPVTLDAVPYVDAAAGRVLVPVRFITEALGADVEWLDTTSQAVIRDGSLVMVITMGSRSVLVNGTAVVIDTTPMIVPPGRILVPVRFLCETVGADVDYNDATGRITITR